MQHIHLFILSFFFFYFFYAGKFGKCELSDIRGYAELPDTQVLSGSEGGNLLMWEGNFIKTEVFRKGKKKCHDGDITVCVCVCVFIDRQECGWMVEFLGDLRPSFIVRSTSSLDYLRSH